jgi:hypothetical protein
MLVKKIIDRVISFNSKSNVNSSIKFVGKQMLTNAVALFTQINVLLSPLLDPLEGLSMLNCGKLGLEGHSRIPTLKGGRGAC